MSSITNLSTNCLYHAYAMQWLLDIEHCRVFANDRASLVALVRFAHNQVRNELYG